MGKRGPKPKPTGLRVFEGDPGRLLNKREGEIKPPPADDLTPPAWLRKHGKEQWMHHAPILHAIGCLAETHKAMFAIWCDLWDTYHAARERTLDGNVCGPLGPHPAIGVQAKAITLIKQIGAEFGLTPSSMVGLNTGPKDSGDQLDEFKRHG